MTPALCGGRDIADGGRLLALKTDSADDCVVAYYGDGLVMGQFGSAAARQESDRFKTERGGGLMTGKAR